MTRTFKLTNGGITFGADHRIEIVGEPNQLSLEEVLQRTEIRFTTQTRTNLMHPNEGFDFWSLLNVKKDPENAYPVKIDQLIKQEVMATLAQDNVIDYTNAEINIARSETDNRGWEVRVNYTVKGNSTKQLEYIGGLNTL
jgi:hypothetical protein